MDKRLFVAAYRIAFGLLAISAMGWQAWSLHDSGVFRPFNFFSFFTIQSNIIAALVFLCGGVLKLQGKRTPEWFELIRGASVVYMAITGVVFALLLSGMQEDLDTHIAWVNNVVHKVMPAVVVLDWLIDPPGRRIALRKACLWLAFPMVWLVYTLARGPFVDWYPYPFVDHRLEGWGHVALIGTAILVGFAATAWATAAIGNLRAGSAGTDVKLGHRAAR